MSTTISVDATADDVREALKQALSPEEYGAIAVEDAPGGDDPFGAPKRGEAITILTIVTWAGGAVAGNVLGNAAYDVLKKATAALMKRFGADRVVVEEPPHD